MTPSHREPESDVVPAPPSAGPLHGVKVVELAGIGPGPFAAMILAELGADVLRIDRPGPADGGLPLQYDLLRRARPSVEIDLRSEAGREQVLALVERADILIEGNRPGVTERLGVGPADCWSHNPRLVYGRMTGWGQEGPLAQRAGHDITYLAVSGALHAIGRAGEGPVMPVNLLGDFAGGSMYLVTGLVAALWAARNSGRGQVVDAAIVDGAASLTTLLHGMIAAGTWSTERGTNMLDGGLPWYDVYRTNDDQWMAVGALEPKFFAEFCRLLPLDASETDRADKTTWPTMREQIAQAFATRSRAEWTDVFSATDACVAPVLSLTEAKDHPHLRHRGTYVTVSGVPQPGTAPRFSHTPSTVDLAVDESRVSVAEMLAKWQ